MRLLRGNDPRLDTLSGIISRAAIAPEAWQDVISALGQVFPGVRLQFWGSNLLSEEIPVSLTYGYEPEFLQSFIDHFRFINPWWLPSTRQTPGRTYRKSELLADEDVQTTEFYNDWTRPQDDTIGGGGQFLMRDRDRTYWLGGAVPRRYRETMEQDFLQVVSALAPSIRHALQVNREIQGLRTELAASRVGLDTNGAAVLLLDQERRVIHCNREAAALLEIGHHVSLSARGQVTAESLAARLSLDRLSASRRPGIERIMSFARGEIRVMHLVRLTTEQAEGLNVLPTSLSQAPVKILVIAPSRAMPEQSSPLTTEHGLTPAEVEVVMQLASGLSPKEIAEMRQASVHTVRNQIKSALGKTGLRRQSELAVLGVIQRRQ